MKLIEFTEKLGNALKMGRFSLVVGRVYFYHGQPCELIDFSDYPSITIKYNSELCVIDTSTIYPVEFLSDEYLFITSIDLWFSRMLFLATMEEKSRKELMKIIL